MDTKWPSVISLLYGVQYFQDASMLLLVSTTFIVEQNRHALFCPQIHLVSSCWLLEMVL